MRKYSHIFELLRNSMITLIHILLYTTSLLKYLVTIDHFLRYFYREQIYVCKIIQFYISTRIFSLQKEQCFTFIQ